MIAWRPCDGSTRTSCSASGRPCSTRHATHSPSGWKRCARAVRCPYLAIHGIDPGPAYAAWLTGLIPTATVEVWEGLGHYPHLVDPDRFVRRLEEFWTDGLTYDCGARRGSGGIRTTNLIRM